MHLKRVIPCLDVDGGRVVKGTNFVDLRDAGDPVELAERYDAEGADELIFLDITATHERRDTIVDLARRTADNVFIPFTIGGGIRVRRGRPGGARRRAPTRSRSTRPRVARPELIDELVEVFGSQCVVLAIDARASARCSWPAAGRRRGATPWRGRARAWSAGAGEILLTSMDRDGTEDGYDLALTAAVSSARLGPGDRLGRRGDARPPGRGAPGGRRRRAGRLDLPLRDVHDRRGQGGARRRGRPGSPSSLTETGALDPCGTTAPSM